jgi:hypothetical protein
LTPTRFELPAQNTGKSADSENGGAKSGAFSAQKPPIDPYLASLIEAWPALSAETRQAILALAADAG